MHPFRYAKICLRQPNCFLLSKKESMLYQDADLSGEYNINNAGKDAHEFTAIVKCRLAPYQDCWFSNNPGRRGNGRAGLGRKDALVGNGGFQYFRVSQAFAHGKRTDVDERNMIHNGSCGQR